MLVMEQKLYYRDAYLKSFNAELLKQGEDERRPYAVISQTAFYPTGGGQPFDTGTLNGVEVLDVEEVDGEIRHYLAEPLSESEKVEGAIDWERRFDHMQQHSGQHILSAAFEELFQYRTLSFHLGKEILTIDLDTDTLSQAEVAEAEKLANLVILENRPIVTKWVNSEELKQYKLRKELSVSENIRLVIIPDFDYNGCGGTHPESTGQVASLKILSWERQKKKVRVEFICGARVLNQLEKKHILLQQLTSLLNAPEQDMEEAVKRMLENRKELEKEAEVSKDTLLAYEASELIERSSNDVISKIYQDRNVQELQKLARLLVTKADAKTFILLVENTDKFQFVFARGSSAHGNMKELAAKVLGLINGKGGGSEAFAQGGGEKHMPAEQFMKQVEEMLIS
jgi:alanyl-tRNA synthetase